MLTRVSERKKNEMIVRRPLKKKTASITFRMTSAEKEGMEELKKQLDFESTTDVVCFSMQILKVLAQKHEEGHRFYFGHSTRKLTELEIEFSPEEKKPYCEECGPLIGHVGKMWECNYCHNKHSG